MDRLKSECHPHPKNIQHNVKCIGVTSHAQLTCVNSIIIASKKQKNQITLLICVQLTLSPKPVPTSPGWTPVLDFPVFFFVLSFFLISFLCIYSKLTFHFLNIYVISIHITEYTQKHVLHGRCKGFSKVILTIHDFGFTCRFQKGNPFVRYDSTQIYKVRNIHNRIVNLDSSAQY